MKFVNAYEQSIHTAWVPLCWNNYISTDSMDIKRITFVTLTVDIGSSLHQYTAMT
jgi:hypothetical protein